MLSVGPLSGSLSNTIFRLQPSSHPCKSVSSVGTSSCKRSLEFHLTNLQFWLRLCRAGLSVGNLPSAIGGPRPPCLQAGRLSRLPRQLFLQVGDEIGERDPFLTPIIAVADGNGVQQFRFFAQRFEVDRDAEGCAGLVLAGVAAADGTAIVVKHGEVFPQQFIDAA